PVSAQGDRRPDLQRPDDRLFRRPRISGDDPTTCDATTADHDHGPLTNMQLDRTRIAIRERGLLETIDLSLHVIRLFAGPVLACSLVAIVPLALINYALVGWMMPSEIDVDSIGFRYFWNMTVLIFLEAPLASVFIVAYLGPAVFLEERSLQQVA